MTRFTGELDLFVRHEQMAGFTGEPVKPNQKRLATWMLFEMYRAVPQTVEKEGGVSFYAELLHVPITEAVKEREAMFSLSGIVGSREGYSEGEGFVVIHFDNGKMTTFPAEIVPRED